MSSTFATQSYLVDKALEPYLAQIDALEDSVVKLEQVAYKLDAYSKQLGKPFYRPVSLTLSSIDCFPVSTYSLFTSLYTWQPYASRAQVGQNSGILTGI